MDWTEPLAAEFWIRLAVALVCGGSIGLERQLRGKPAGMRTSMLVCLGTYFYVRLGSQLGVEHGDPTRVLGQVVTGIGFLGAGVILTRGGQVIGITSAAVMWMLAAIGSAVAVDRLGAAVAITLTTLGILVGLNMLEKGFAVLRRGVHEEGPIDDASHRIGVRPRR